MAAHASTAEPTTTANGATTFTDNTHGLIDVFHDVNPCTVSVVENQLEVCNSRCHQLRNPTQSRHGFVPPIWFQPGDVTEVGIVALGRQRQKVIGAHE